MLHYQLDRSHAERSNTPEVKHGDASVLDKACFTPPGLLIVYLIEKDS